MYRQTTCTHAHPTDPHLCTCLQQCLPHVCTHVYRHAYAHACTPVEACMSDVCNIMMRGQGQRGAGRPLASTVAPKPVACFMTESNIPLTVSSHAATSIPPATAVAVTLSAVVGNTCAAAATVAAAAAGCCCCLENIAHARARTHTYTNTHNCHYADPVAAAATCTDCLG